VAEVDEIRYSRGKSIDSNLANCDYFRVDRYYLNSAVFFNVDFKSFNSVLCLDGEGEIFCDNKTYPIKKGDSYFIPAGLGKYTVSGKVEIIVSRI
jgi:mannose-6-phosphate isomerase